MRFEIKIKRNETGTSGNGIFLESSLTSNEVPKVETIVAFNALVGDLVSVVNAEGQANQSKAHSHQQEEDHHHVKTTIQRPHKFRENWRWTCNHFQPPELSLGLYVQLWEDRVDSTLPACQAGLNVSLLDTCLKMCLIKPIIHT